MSKRERAKLPKLTIAKQSGPPPKHLKSIDLRKGTGVAVTSKDAIVVKFFSVSYPEALQGSNSGGFGPERFGMNEVIKGWALGLPGMKVGGRRELVVPPKLGYQGTTLIYLIDLISVEQNGAASF